jgi:hypothetical protein
MTRGEQWDGVARGGKKTALAEQFTKEMADTVLAQLGGNRFIAMTGAKHFLFDPTASNISFKIGSGAKDAINFVKITYNRGGDDYTMEFFSSRGVNLVPKGKVVSVYGDQLQSIFTKYTGFDTRL